MSDIPNWTVFLAGYIATSLTICAGMLISIADTLRKIHKDQ